MKEFKCSIFLFLVLGSMLLFLAACDLAKKVPEGSYLLKENKLVIPDEITFKESNLRSVIRQKPNFKTAGIKLNLIAYNIVDSAFVANKRKKKNVKLRKKNKKRLERQKRINKRRIEKALDRGEKVYKPKTVKLKDTINPRPFYREWLKYEYGEPPVIFDSLTMDISKKQLDLYLKKKGYFQGNVETQVEYDSTKRKATVSYIIDPKTPYIIDTIILETNNSTIRSLYEKFQLENDHALKSNVRFDSDKLAKMRSEFAEYARDASIYGFRSSYVKFEADTLNRDKTIGITIQISSRTVDVDGTTVKKPFASTKVNKVNFHMLDTNSYKGNFLKEKLNNRALSSTDRIPTFDTLRYDWYKGSHSEYRTANFYYNGELSVNPELIEFMNLLEENNYYRGYYVDQSFSRLLQLDLFRTVTPEIIENEDNSIDVNYYLVPSKFQSFSFEPRATNSNGFLGLASSVNYQHRNIFGGGELLKISFSGGFESQPAVFDENLDGSFVSNAGRSFNTLEYGPTVELELPGLFPASITRLSKRQLPKTAISLAYNFQRRDDFKRNLFQFNYFWKFSDTKRTQLFTLGLPFFGGVQYVEIDKSTAFENRLNEQNDLFLLNAYSNQFIWKDLKLSYQYTNQEIRTGNLIFSYGANFDLAGNIVSLITRNNPVNEDGFKEFLGVRYSQFARLDNDIRFNHILSGEKSMNYRLQVGAGLPYENNGPNLPFDYSFFAGGSNDNRGFRARALGPGVYKYYLDTNRTATEIGDIRFGGSVEYRFKISGMFKGAVFSDFGNIWTFNEDPNRLGGQFTSDWYKQLSLAGGAGLRVDLDFLVLRLDVGLPFRNPALPESSRWIFQSREAYEQEGIEVFGEDKYKELMPNPFSPQIHIAIGYPF